MKSKYEEVLLQTFSDSIFCVYHNDDNDTEGWDIYSPNPGKASDMIRFFYWKHDPKLIHIKSYSSDFYQLKITPKLIFSGDLPVNDIKQPDFDFLKKILKNWQSIGY